MTGRANHLDFWKGFVTGSIFGAAAAACARGNLRRFFAFRPEAKPSKPHHSFRRHSTELGMRREASENAGDPTRLSPSIAKKSTAVEPPSITIERSSGNAGPTSSPEMLEVPGQPGRTIDHSDASQRLASALRTHKISPNGN
jgi:hypothetical protein